MFKSTNWQVLREPPHKRKEDRPRIVDQKNHSISRDEISPNACKVLYRLNKSGYEAYLVGGGVRDMLLGLHPKDFDIATNALPQQIRKLFRNSRLIGRRFILVHVYFPNEIIEVSTFRANNVEEFIREEPLSENKSTCECMLLENNTYGTIEEDAWRRDFTVNALYYNITDFSVVDFTGGIEDLNKRIIRIIGDPTKRYHEDPVRLLRAIRLAAKLDFKIHPDTEESLRRLHNLLHHVPSTRLFAEVLKIFFKGHAFRSYHWLSQTNYMQTLFPYTVTVLEKTCRPYYKSLFEFSLKATDQRYSKNRTLNPGFSFAILLWPVVQELMQQYFKKYKRLFPSIYYGINMALRQQVEILAIPRRLTTMIRSVWLLQYHLERRRRSRIYRIVEQRFFRAAFDFLELREQAGEPLTEIVYWWRAFRDGNQKKREQLIDRLNEQAR
ncbi:MAG: polynucleotide adenylyltransferase PcnB [Coxiella-like endosymbiont]|uniref:polynucleotide adenylyltransferase PcnB n=1 Tax=Coxiella-like endosymbiont TaxID=1592897 RepID=UPI00215A9A0A|nr:polynucleotide adenylyltransferase PcnB [Coxiella-like endosymbiont]UVE59750.1 polynucleotide adenylyltransferase PcnB [Coxiella-like endosymbiont]